MKNFIYCNLSRIYSLWISPLNVSSKYLYNQAKWRFISLVLFSNCFNDFWRYVGWAQLSHCLLTTMLIFRNLIVMLIENIAPLIFMMSRAVALQIIKPFLILCFTMKHEAYFAKTTKTFFHSYYYIITMIIIWISYFEYHNLNIIFWISEGILITQLLWVFFGYFCLLI